MAERGLSWNTEKRGAGGRVAEGGGGSAWFRPLNARDEGEGGGLFTALGIIRSAFPKSHWPMGRLFQCPREQLLANGAMADPCPLR